MLERVVNSPDSIEEVDFARLVSMRAYKSKKRAKKLNESLQLKVEEVWVVELKFSNGSKSIQQVTSREEATEALDQYRMKHVKAKESELNYLFNRFSSTLRRPD